MFFNNDALKKHLMHALIVVYCDSELVSPYIKFKYRYGAAFVMDYIWMAAVYREDFIGLQT